MRIHIPSYEFIPLVELAENQQQPQSTAASGEIGLLFYFRKQFASVIKSFRATPAILAPSYPDKPRKTQSKPSPPDFLRLVFPLFSRRENATKATSEFRIFRRTFRIREERDERIRHGKLLSEIPAMTRFRKYAFIGP